VNDPKPVIIK
jgi:hypothetical protein